MKIKAKNEKLVSTELIVPIDGKITIDAKGEADVSAKCASLLVNSTNDWDFVKGKKKAEVDEQDEEEDENEDEENEDDEEEDENEDDEVIDGINSMNFKQMQDMATEAKYPVEEWEKLKSKALLSQYLINKYKETLEEEEEG